MTLGLKSTGADGAAEDLKPWAGIPGRDECFWITEVNKATLLTNLNKGLLTREEAVRYAAALRDTEEEAKAEGAARPRMYIRYEPLMVKKAGMDVTKMHAGRSSQDIHSTFQRAILRDETLRLLKAVSGVEAGLIRMAEENRGVLLPCYTNGVAAQPSDLAHVLLAHAAAFGRDFDRIEAAYRRLNECPMGSCVLNGTGWPLDRRGMSDYLGFDRPVENTFDAGQVAGTDVAVEASLMLVHPMLQICQFIAEIMQQYAQPHPWILVCSTYASSAMPQKRNPGPIIDIRRDAAAVLANLSSVIFRAHNLPTGMYDAKDEKLNCETVSDAAEVVERFDGLLRLLKVNRERALEELNRDWTASQELADVLMRRFGIPFRVGHSLASRMVSVARENNLTPKTFPHDGMVKLYDALRAEFAEQLPDLPEVFPLDEAAFRALLDPAHIVAERAVEGGPQPESLDRLFASARARLTAETERLNALKRQLDDAEARLHADFASLI